MEKHTIAYIDEVQDEIRWFQQNVYKAFNVLTFVPKPDLDEFVEELIHCDAKAFVADFRLHEFRTDVDGPIRYNGADLIERILEVRQGFPCFVLTSFDDDAAMNIEDVNYVYPKEVLTNQQGNLSFTEKMRLQIEHYQSSLIEKSKRFNDLLEKSETQDLTETEENELLKLDTFLENRLSSHKSLPEQKKSQLAIGKIDELIESTNALLNRIRENRDEAI